MSRRVPILIDVITTFYTENMRADWDVHAIRCIRPNDGDNGAALRDVCVYQSRYCADNSTRFNGVRHIINKVDGCDKRCARGQQ